MVNIYQKKYFHKVEGNCDQIFYYNQKKKRKKPHKAIIFTNKEFNTNIRTCESNDQMVRKDKTWVRSQERSRK